MVLSWSVTPLKKLISPTATSARSLMNTMKSPCNVSASTSFSMSFLNCFHRFSLGTLGVKSLIVSIIQLLNKSYSYKSMLEIHPCKKHHCGVFDRNANSSIPSFFKYLNWGFNQLDGFKSLIRFLYHLKVSRDFKCQYFKLFLVGAFSLKEKSPTLTVSSFFFS